MVRIQRGYTAGCIGRIVGLHAAYYARHAGFGLSFESKVATELAAFCVGYREERDGLWLALREGEVQGAIAIDGSHAASHGAHLRWFIISDALRGQGAGTRLLNAALQFCDERRYAQVRLWTFDGLHAARHLYEKHGFGLVQTRRGAQWGKEVDEQLFVRAMARPHCRGESA